MKKCGLNWRWCTINKCIWRICVWLAVSRWTVLRRCIRIWWWKICFRNIISYGRINFITLLTVLFYVVGLNSVIRYWRFCWINYCKKSGLTISISWLIWKNSLMMRNFVSNIARLSRRIKFVWRSLWKFVSVLRLIYRRFSIFRLNVCMSINVSIWICCIFWRCIKKFVKIRRLIAYRAFFFSARKRYRVIIWRRILFLRLIKWLTWLITIRWLAISWRWCFCRIIAFRRRKNWFRRRIFSNKFRL